MKVRSLAFPFYRYGRYGWKNKEDCWGIQELSCDLTNETSDLQELYYGRVSTAWSGKLSDWSISPRFMPLWESECHRFILPLLFLPMTAPPQCGWSPGSVLAEVHPTSHLLPTTALRSLLLLLSSAGQHYLD